MAKLNSFEELGKKFNRDKPKSENAKMKGDNIYGTANEHYLTLPVDTSTSLNVNDIDNFYLKLNKTVHFVKEEKSRLYPDADFEERKAMLFRGEFRDKNDTQQDKKGKLKHFEIPFEFKEKQITNINRKHCIAIKHLNIQKECLEQSINWRLIVGLGHPSVYETSMTLHYIYGIPYIPASAVKGILRSWIIQTCFGDTEKAEKEAEENELFKHVFGTQKQAGKVWFFDAFPQQPPKIEADIMNVHYPDYYSDNSGKKAPTDYQNPRPINFLTVGEKGQNGEKQTFKFYFGIKGPENKQVCRIDKEFITKLIQKPKEDEKNENKTNDFIPEFESESTVLCFVKKFLQIAFEQHGIGAKTAVGYGRMSEKINNNK